MWYIKNWYKKHTLRGRVKAVEAQFKPTGDGWSNTLKYEVQELTTWISKLQGEVNFLNNVIKEAGIVEDVDVSDIKFRDVKHSNGIFGSYTSREAYQINQVKVK